MLHLIAFLQLFLAQADVSRINASLAFNLMDMAQFGLTCYLVWTKQEKIRTGTSKRGDFIEIGGMRFYQGEDY